MDFCKIKESVVGAVAKISFIINRYAIVTKTSEGINLGGKQAYL